jgi:hypothetical protein
MELGFLGIIQEPEECELASMMWNIMMFPVILYHSTAQLATNHRWQIKRLVLAPSNPLLRLNMTVA